MVHCVLTKWNGNEQHPLQIFDTPPGTLQQVNLTTPPPPSRASDSVVRLGNDEDGYRPHFVHSNCGNIPSNVASSSSNTQEEPFDSQDVAANLSEMRKKNGFWEGFSVEVEEYGAVQTQLEA
ncbi:hypothetical protein FRX31_033897 [Thalictrum thalictroides]|uniref:Uncharacterized protein n=1 Tax=Thalictrum thalictroides TaxID=46969 RepID=A0A7J6UVB3_THATH|nr:hypothetical protein FRX31_033897 [Thalictrum thalictroides]